MTTTTTTRGTFLPCPLCGQTEATIHLSLANTEDLHCEDCDGDFTPDDIRAFILRWQPVLAWIDTFPR